MSKDKNIKSVLKDREIQPSADAWNKLNVQLDENNTDETNTSKKNDKIIYYGIAASILLIVLTTLFYNINSTPLEAPEFPTVTQTKKEIIQSNSTDTPTLNSKTKTEQHTLTQTKVPAERNIKQLPPQVKIKQSFPDLTERKLDKSIVSSNDTLDTVNTTNEFSNYDNSPSQITANQSFENSDSIVLQSADELLAQALKQNQLEQNDKTIAIDSKQLLNIVEEDIFIENKPDLLNKLTQQFKSIQVALNERNQE